ncbi:phospholipase A2 [Helicoverpa armigera]|uniref:phospholipase A2 n=1 Tax=Helicoverpa armigera TaxID=29058 RepID=UPI002113842E|nr:phospholipase A2 [Helicoverpa armigera]
MLKVILLSCLLTLFFDSHNCWIINDINIKMLSRSAMNNDVLEDQLVDETTISQKNINLIYPGTKWCGAGNIADNYDDLGTEREADICCRDHDNCPDTIPGGQTKYNLTNEVFYTRLSCKCDNKFLKCLRSAKTKTAKYIGMIYFNALQTKCFRNDYPVTECKKRGGWLNSKCLEYSYDKTGEKKYQWFEVPDF